MPIPFLKAKPGQCRYPLWSDAESIGDVCGSRTDAGESYCPACRRRTLSGLRPSAPFVPQERAPRAPRRETEADLVDMLA